MQQPPDALREALAQVLVDARRDARHEIASIKAEAAQAIAALRGEVVELRSALERAAAERLATLKDGEPGQPGKPGEPGRQGPEGRLSAAKAWSDTVHYDRDVVTHKGATYQAIRDTGHEPPHADWTLLAGAGRDGQEGRSFTVRGTWSPTEEYRALDVVALNGGSFAARKDNPGPCPGESWQLIASQGKTGKPGEPGARGEKGLPGPPGPAVVNLSIDSEGLLTLTNADGSRAECDLYPVLSKLAR